MIYLQMNLSCISHWPMNGCGGHVKINFMFRYHLSQYLDLLQGYSPVNQLMGVKNCEIKKHLVSKSRLRTQKMICLVYSFFTGTVNEEHALLLFSRRSENSDWILQWWPMGKYILKHK